MILLEGGAERAWSEMEVPYDTAEAERERETFLLQTLFGGFFFFFLIYFVWCFSF